MGSHITTNIKSIKTFQFDTTCSFIKSKVIAAILNCKMKTFTISSLVFLIVAIAFVAKATGKRVPTYVSGIGQCFGPDKLISKCWEEFGSGNGSAEVVACCKEKGVSEKCIKHCEGMQPPKQLHK